jgi:hypothetical protein
MIEAVQRGKAVDMESYLGRDVPVMNDKIKAKLSGPLPEFKKEGESSGGEGTHGGSKRSKHGDSTLRKNKGIKEGESDGGGAVKADVP